MNYVIEDKYLILSVNDDNIKETIKKTRRLIRLCDKKNLILKIKYNDKLIDKENSNYSKDLNDLVMIKNAINYKTKEERYNYIYDTVCKILDDRINTENYCEFENDVCIRFKKENPNHKNGCCEWVGRGKCKYLVDSVCTMKTCMACKLFTCKFLYREKGIKQNIKDYVLTKYFFNWNQRSILACSFWTPKEIVMKRIIEDKFIVKY